MLNQNKYLTFIPSVEPTSPPSCKDLWFIFKDNLLLVEKKETVISIPKAENIEIIHSKLVQTHHLGTFKGSSCYIGELENDIELLKNLEFTDLRSYMTHSSDDQFFLAGRAFQIINWDRTHKFCGKCGSKTDYKMDERAKICPKCGMLHFPHIAPAIIVAIVKDNKILLAHNVNFTSSMHSVIAGFVEPGETFEECVKREVKEEVGIEVKNIKYFESQPWPFPNSLMIAFTAEYAGGEISVDGKEIDHADWFDTESLPLIPNSKSVARKLIQWFIKNYS